MAKNIGKLSVKVTANTSGLQQMLNKAKRSIVAFGGFVNSIGSSLAFPVLGTIVAGSIAAAAGLSHVANKMDAVGKASDRLGLATETLIAMQHGAMLAGVAVEDLDNSILTMLKNTSMAAAGQGKAVKAFEQLGLDPAKLNMLDTGEKMRVLADAIGSIANTGDRARVALQVFGESGANLLPLLTQGSEGIDAMEQRAAALGITFSRIDSAKVEQAKDALSEVKAVLEGIGAKIVVEVAPYVTALANKFLDAATESNGFADKTFRGMEIVSVGVGYVIDGVEALELGFRYLQAGVAKALSWIIREIGKSQARVGEFAQAWDSITPGDQSAIVQGFADNVQMATEWADALDGVAEDAMVAADAITNDAWASDKVRAFFAEARAQADATAKAVKRTLDPTELLGPVVDDFNDSITEYSEWPEKMKKAAKEVREVLNPAENKLVRVGTQEAYAYTMSGPMKEMAKFQRDQLALSKRQTQSLEEIAENTDPDNEVVYDLPG